MSWNPADYNETSDEKLYRMFNLRVFGQRKPDVIQDTSGHTHLESVDLESIQIYPNPARTGWKLSGTVPGVNYFLYSSQGQLLRHGTSEDADWWIPRDSLPEGVYFLHLEYDGGSTKRKLILQD